ncbi:hypothetical protein ACPPVO_36020 [Dactylosporangium sp. McL0621]|uniref:hypothetical protein n=1 Tax=Dactylosporangium sp. McL0621 TaxID=3415678 RepID=UPI003CF2C4E2
MPRHPDTEVVPNPLFVEARNRLRSARWPDRPISRPELADTVNATLDRLFPGQDMRAHYVDFRWIGKIERGEHRWPAAERRAALRHVLHAATDADLGLFPNRRPHDATRTGLHPAATPAVPDQRCEAGVEALDSAEAWLHRLGDLAATLRDGISTDLLERARRHLRVLDRLQHNGARADLAPADARWSELASWLTDNAGEPDVAVWLQRAQHRARVTGDQALNAYTLMRHSQHALDGGDTRAAIILARRSLTYGPVPARTHVLCLARMAEALAACGDDTTVTVVAQARRRIRGAGVDPADDFANHCDLRYVTAVDARCRQLLGDTASAATILDDLLSEPGLTPLDAGVWHAHLGECHHAADPQRAARHGSRALQLAAQAGSYRPIRAVQALAVTLRPHRALLDVQKFLQAHQQAVTGPVPR